VRLTYVTFNPTRGNCKPASRLIRRAMSKWDINPIVPAFFANDFSPRPLGFLQTHTQYFDGLMDLCQEVWVLMLPGWDRYPMVKHEVRRATQEGFPVEFIDPTYMRLGRFECKEEDDEMVRRWHNEVLGR